MGKIIFSLESDVIEVFDDTDTVESRMLGLSEVSSELDQQVDTTDVRMDVLEDVEQLAETVRESIEEGGLDTLSARTIQTSIESFMNISNVNPLVKSKISLEGFDNLKFRNTKTLSLEAEIKDNIKSIMKSIIDGIKYAYDMLIDFIVKVLDASKRMKAKALALKEKLSNMSELEIKDIDVLGQFQTLRIGNAFPTSDKLIDGLSIIREKTVANICKSMADQMHKVVESKGEIGFNIGVVLSEIKSKSQNLTSTLPKALQEKFDLFAEELKLGNQAIIYLWPKPTTSKVEKFVYSLLLKEAYITVIPRNGLVNGPPKEANVKSLDKSDGLKVIDEVVKNLDTLIKIPDSKAELKRLISDAESLSKDAYSPEAQAELLKSVAKGCNSIANKIMKLQTSYRNYVIKTGNASLQLVAKSMAGVKVE